MQAGEDCIVGRCIFVYIYMWRDPVCESDIIFKKPGEPSQK